VCWRKSPSHWFLYRCNIFKLVCIYPPSPVSYITGQSTIWTVPPSFPALHLACHELHSQISVKCCCCVCWSRAVDGFCTGTWEMFVNRAKTRGVRVWGWYKTFSGCWRNFRRLDFSILYLKYSNYPGHSAWEMAWFRIMTCQQTLHYLYVS